MQYYVFIADTPYTGTTNYYPMAVEEELTKEEIANICEEYARENGESYSYLATGWCEDWESEEEEENYYADCSCECIHFPDEKSAFEYAEEYGFEF